MRQRTQIVILHYGDENKTLQCLSDVEKAHPQHGALIIENGEKRSSIQPTQNRALQWVGYNAGYAGGMNHGLANSIRFGYEFAYLLANDTSGHDQETLTVLEAMMDANPRLAFVAPTSLNEKAEKRTFPLPWMFGAIPISSDAVLVRLSAIKEIGGYDERFHTFYEDVDLYSRALAEGWESAMCESCFIKHPTNKRPSRKSRFREARNFWLYADKHGLPSGALRSNMRDTAYLIRHRPSDAFHWVTGQGIGLFLWGLSRAHLLPKSDPKKRLFTRVRDWPIYPLRGGMRHRSTFTKEE